MLRKENKFVGHAQDGPGLIPLGILNKRHLGNKIFVIFKKHVLAFLRDLSSTEIITCTTQKTRLDVV